jgi:molybdopterin/thiamine biosynthesis adenylyltransferase
MAPDMRARYGRQVRLPEIGEAGQARLLASEVVIGGAGDARTVEAAYVARAGSRVVDDAKAEALALTKAIADGSEKTRADVFASLGLKDVSVREVGDGALRALLAMRKILGMVDGAGGGNS